MTLKQIELDGELKASSILVRVVSTEVRHVSEPFGARVRKGTYRVHHLEHGLRAVEPIVWEL